MRVRNAFHIADVLRDRIVSLELKPGTILTRAELQSQFNTSSTPIRDSLILLEEEHLVEIYPQHMTRVSLIDVHAASLGHFHRMALEIEVVRRLAKSCRADYIDQMRASIEFQTAMLAIGQKDKFSVADGEFHYLLFQAAGVEKMWSLARKQSGHMDRLRQLNLPLKGKAEQVVAEHTDIVEAIASSDALAAERIVRTHLSHTINLAPTLAARHPDYFQQ
jgi:DNA-binding GntR family transcriptional regulator